MANPEWDNYDPDQLKPWPDVSVDHALEVLNRLFKADPRAMHELVETRVSCNEALARDPTTQVAGYGNPSGYRVGILGVLNGLFGMDSEGWGPIAAVFGEEGNLIGFTRSDDRSIKRG